MTLRNGHGKRLSQSILQITPLSQEVCGLYLDSWAQVLYALLLCRLKTPFACHRLLILTGNLGFFRSPPPGQPRSSTPSQLDLKLGQKVLDLHDPVARANFRVVIIRPEEVECLDLTDQENGKRWNWTLIDGSDGSRWDEAELWP